MLKLINIKEDKNIIEADYIPEQSNVSAHIRLNTANNEYTVDSVSNYGAMYNRMALNGLRRTVDEFKSGKIKTIPKERVVMWY